MNNIYFLIGKIPDRVFMSFPGNYLQDYVPDEDERFDTFRPFRFRQIKSFYE